MRTVYSKQELEVAIQHGEKQILAKGEFAKQLQKANQYKKAAKAGGAALVAIGLVAAPFTAGASLSATAMGLTIGGVTISAAELSIILGGGIAITGVLKGKKVKLHFNDNGTVTLEVG